jgi:hypothetical protein
MHHSHQHHFYAKKIYTNHITVASFFFSLILGSITRTPHPKQAAFRKGTGGPGSGGTMFAAAYTTTTSKCPTQHQKNNEK